MGTERAVAPAAHSAEVGGSSVQFRPGRREDVPAVAVLLTDGAERLRTTEGDVAWPIPFPESEVAAAVDRGELVVGTRGPALVAAFYFSWSDVRIWGEQPPVAGYVHKFVVARTAAHRGYGRQALAWAAARCLEAGRPLVRLDTLATNAPLVALYLRYGFRPVRIARLEIPGRRREFQLFEASASELHRPPAPT